jgi:hypothetical protein
VQVSPHSTAQVSATILVPEDAKPGLYQGFIRFIGDNHTTNAPVSFGVTSLIQKDKLTMISGQKNSDIMYGNGYIKGAFDMTNRYNAGDWRQYYFDIDDSTINAASIDISWKDSDTNFSAFVVDPQGRIIQSNVPAGVFGTLLDWPTSDWLGTTPFSEGGGFYPVKNKDATSTLLSAPINQTGTYTLLLHSTLFGGQSTTEPFTVIGRFSSIAADDSPPEISFAIDSFTNVIPALTVTDDGNVSIRYYLDGTEIVDLSAIPEGTHTLKIEATDDIGNTSVQFHSFVFDRTVPEILVQSPQDNARISDMLNLAFTIQDANLGAVSVLLPDGIIIQNQTSIDFDTSGLSDGKYEITISGVDKAANKSQKTIPIEISRVISAPKHDTSDIKFDYNLVLLIIAAVIAIGISIFIILGNKSQKSYKH